MRLEHFDSECSKKHLFGINERAIELISNLQMRATRRRNSRGEFIAPSDGQVVAVENQVAANAAEQRQVVAPVDNTTKFGALVTLKTWQIAVTPDRAQVCLWSFLMITKFLSILSIISFWFCALMCIKTLPGWNGPNQVIAGFVRRREPAAAPVAPAADAPADPPANPPAPDNIWTDVFPAAEALNSYTLRLALTQNGNQAAPVIWGRQIPLLFGNPLVWMILIALSFFIYHFLSFIHGCLERAYRATTVIARRRST